MTYNAQSFPTHAASGILARGGAAGSKPGSGSRPRAMGDFGGSMNRRYMPLSLFFAGSDLDKTGIKGKPEPKPDAKRRAALMKAVKKRSAKTESGAALAGKAGPMGPPGGTMSGNIAFVPVPIGAGDGRKFIDVIGGGTMATKSKRKKKRRKKAQE